MNIRSISSPIANRIVFRNTKQVEQSQQANTRSRHSGYQEFFLRNSLQRLRDAVLEFDGPAPENRTVRSGGRTGVAASATSSQTLQLNTTEATSATLNSTEEINTTPTSFTPRGPAFQFSSSTPTIDGVYNGNQGDNTLTFRVELGGLVGVSPLLTLEVTDDSGGSVETVNLESYQPNEAIELYNGLELYLSSGTLTAGDEFEISVSSTVGSAVAPDNPFNGVRNQDPNFENGTNVEAGSFRVNGQLINVDETDSINTVLGKINASNAGVTANFNDALETIEFVQDSAGSQFDISLTDDTSGFLSATKLSGASLMMGKDATNDLTDVLASVDQFASVSSGNLVINGNSVAIDVETDSLSNVLDKINTSNAGVNALLEDGVVKLENEDNEQVLSLSDNTGFLNAVELAPGVFEPVDAIASQKRQIRGLSNSDAKQLERNIEKFGERANEFFSDNFLAELPSEKIQSVREELFSLFSSAQSSDGDETSSIFTINDNKIEITENLEQTLKNNPNDFNQIFFGQSDNSEETFLERLISTIDANLARTQAPLDLGSIVNILV